MKKTALILLMCPATVVLSLLQSILTLTAKGNFIASGIHRLTNPLLILLLLVSIGYNTFFKGPVC